MDQPSSNAEPAEFYEQTAVGPLECERKLAVECFFQEIDRLHGHTTGLSNLFFRNYNPNAHCIMADFKCKDDSRTICLRGDTVKNIPTYIGSVYYGDAFEFHLSFDFFDKSTTLLFFYDEAKSPGFFADHDTHAGCRQYSSDRVMPCSNYSHIPFHNFHFVMDEEHHQRICEAYQHFLVWSDEICKTRSERNILANLAERNILTNLAERNILANVAERKARDRK